MDKKTKLRKRLPYIIGIVLVLVVTAVFVLRLFDWQIKDGNEYLQAANASVLKKVSIDAARGEILDKDGNPLASNKTAYKIVCEKQYMTDETINDTINAVTQLLEKRKEQWINDIPIELNSSGDFAFRDDREEAIEFLKGKSFLNMNSYATADQCVDRLVELYDVDRSKYSKEELLNILSVRYNMTVKNFSTEQPYTLSDSISKDTAAVIKEMSTELPGVSIEVTTNRYYDSGDLVPHLIGTVGKLTEKEYEQLSNQGYSYDDVTGKSGIEAALESELRGEDGEKVIELNNDGSVRNTKITKEPSQGNTVYTTIDSDLQKVASESLESNIKSVMGGTDCVAGGVVVIDIKDFSVLAAASYPTFDLQKLVTDTDYYEEIATASDIPLFDRTTSGQFTPGSIFKPCVAAAALEEGVISEGSTVNCQHTYTYFAPSYIPTCMGTHGSLSVRDAIGQSCNIFFFDTGRQLGIDNIDLYANAFGLGTSTGIEIDESTGILASPQERAQKGGVWVPGDVIQAAIGQSDNVFTPMQLATYCATIANNGTRLKTHFVSKVTDYERKNVISETKAQIAEEVPVSEYNIRIVQEGMRNVATNGTASSVFSSYGIAVACKTGTAEVPGHSDNTTFIGYAPYDDPQIAVAVVLEYGADGVASMNVARDIFDEYFKDIIEEWEKENQARIAEQQAQLAAQQAQQEAEAARQRAESEQHEQAEEQTEAEE